jgi:hypothetical protein
MTMPHTNPPLRFLSSFEKQCAAPTLALMEMTKWPPFFKKLCAFSATIRVWKQRGTPVTKNPAEPGGKGHSGRCPYLVWLGHVGKDAVDHGHQHAILVRVTRVLDDGNHVGALLGLPRALQT